MLHSGKMKNQISSGANATFNLMFIVIVLLCISPLILVVMVSITDEQTLGVNGYSFFPEKFSFLAYRYILSDMNQIFQSYGVSLFVTIAGTLLSLLIISLYAYTLSRKEFKYRNWFSFLVFFTMLFNGGLVPTFLVYTKLLGWSDTLWMLIFPSLMTPMYVIIMKTFFATSIPDSLVESAKIDGAGDFRIFFSIIIRLSTPALATIGLFNTLHYWNDWFTALMYITSDELMPLQFLLFRVQSSLAYLIQISAQTGQGSLSMADLPGQSAQMALCVIAIGPIIMAYPFFQKYIVKGLTIGAIKG
ncbi:carbohydrate ABC transporter permease [Paenibacillus sinopodophylli]|uniref:carbohydrate ABC transporter permease n=1 Tax=Paenibacillus sinopodophylli TaxID=1837342 RepID=UPI00110CB84D|nr:carbohydrate ABC transporter permease [Paenibacillus sinopodophylli]